MSARAEGAGFTLVEVLIAMAITVLVGALVVGTFVQVDRANEIVRDQGDRYGASRMALTRISQEISMAFVSEHYDKSQFRDRPTLFIGKDDQLLFTTMAHQRAWVDTHESDQALVEYTLDEDPNHHEEKALFRREKVHIDADYERGGRRDVVAEHVRSIRFSYFDPARNEYVHEWSTRSIDHLSDLPMLVRIELEVTLADGRPEKLTTEARIAITRPLDF